MASEIFMSSKVKVSKDLKVEFQVGIKDDYSYREYFKESKTQNPEDLYIHLS